MTSSNRGQIVGKECDHGSDVLLTHHASCSTRALSRNSAGRWLIRVVQRRQAGGTAPRRGRGHQEPCAAKHKVGRRVAAVRVRPCNGTSMMPARSVQLVLPGALLGPRVPNVRVGKTALRGLVAGGCSSRYRTAPSAAVTSVDDPQSGRVAPEWSAPCREVTAHVRSPGQRGDEDASAVVDAADGRAEAGPKRRWTIRPSRHGVESPP